MPTGSGRAGTDLVGGRKASGCRARHAAAVVAPSRQQPKQATPRIPRRDVQQLRRPDGAGGRHRATKQRCLTPCLGNSGELRQRSRVSQSTRASRVHPIGDTAGMGRLHIAMCGGRRLRRDPLTAHRLLSWAVALPKATRPIAGFRIACREAPIAAPSAPPPLVVPSQNSTRSANWTCLPVDPIRIPPIRPKSPRPWTVPGLRKLGRLMMLNRSVRNCIRTRSLKSNHLWAEMSRPRKSGPQQRVLGDVPKTPTPGLSKAEVSKYSLRISDRDRPPARPCSPTRLGRCE